MKMTILLAAMSLSACATTVKTPAQPSGSCDAAKVQDLIGASSAAAVQADAQKRSGAARVRVYETGSVVTMDYSADRLNIETNSSGVIVKLSCG